MRAAMVLASLLAVAAAACGPSTSGASGGAGPRELSVTMTEFKFSPAAFEVPPGTPVRFNLKNSGTVDHDFVIDKADVRVTVKPGATATRNVSKLEAGTYEILCTVPGHKEAGMVATLTVK